MQEAVAKGTDVHKMRSGAFRSKCRGVTGREPRKGDRETWLLPQAPAPPGHLTVELHVPPESGTATVKASQSVVGTYHSTWLFNSPWKTGDTGGAQQKKSRNSQEQRTESAGSGRGTSGRVLVNLFSCVCGWRRAGLSPTSL
ncbi:hypothetical protein HJG60_007803 [Phyllostomus discolor]|uniref:Uncharacterized protein n=1 Tax=Phyllostomus discolor TaxID=89673 RepID=A0A834BKY1_9CHIR|nr:hypothetical protein HJG60_007803 [Phyllostomus discolor]